jgi:hypothetical protein
VFCVGSIWLQSIMFYANGKKKRRKQNKNIRFFGQLIYIYNVSHPIVWNVVMECDVWSIYWQ